VVDAVTVNFSSRIFNQWIDDINKTDWEQKQIALLLSILPFEKNSWDRAAQLLGENDFCL
jgi:hypothetical protein